MVELERCATTATAYARRAAHTRTRAPSSSLIGLDRMSCADVSSSFCSISHDVRLRILRGTQAAVASLEPHAPPSLQTLPDSVLSRILEHLPLNARLALSQSSRRLREFALGTPHLWASMRLPSSAPAWTMAETETSHPRAPTAWTAIISLLRRSEPLAASVDIFLDVAAPYDALYQVITHALQRSRELRLEAFARLTGIVQRWDDHGRYTSHLVEAQSPIDEPQWKQLSSFLCMPAPSLKFLQLRIYNHSGARHYTRTLEPDTLAGEYHELRLCVLVGICLPYVGCKAFWHLTLFDYQPTPAVLGTYDVARMLAQMPQLEVLGLTLDSFNGPYDGTPHTTHRSLIKVALSMHFACAEEILGSISFFQSVGIKELCADLFGYHFQPLPYDIWTTLPAQFSTPDVIEMYLELAIARTGTSSVLFPTQPPYDVLRDSATYERLESLTVCEMHWPENTTLPRAPMLRRLHVIILPACSAQRYRDLQGIFVSLPSTPWDCPLLEEVEFTYLRAASHECILSRRSFQCTCHSTEGTIAFADLARAIRGHFCFSADRLRCVALSGIASIVDADLGAGLAAVLELTEEVTVVEEPFASARRLKAFFTERTASHYAPSQIFERSIREDVDEEWNALRPVHPSG
ncbi:hypothetical protein EXIGLDRAFT_835068 [Exidia glandulosa HHB12029]|uniref:F-box domain-containing protein n=1 Tax=Exidia glandulosa HHB12029 TaxID=1314781 RepID=A0A165J5Y6_EXIGL|nr:hypothetical protein EXIGLDRAFT_835068 [Exidia glandulosa HHB12029]